MSPTIKSRIQLKNDTEAHWRKAVRFIPLLGEIIIYSTDESHPFFRLKVGDGITTVNNLPFVESNAVNGFQLINDYAQLPGIGNSALSYFVASENIVYRWDNSEGYIPVYAPTRTNVTSVTNWDSGSTTQLAVEGNTLIIDNGTIPTLTLEEINVITGYGPVS